MKQALTRNIPLKILSFLLAAVLWVVIMNIDDPYITATIEDIEVSKVNTEVFAEKNKMYEVVTGDYVTIKVRGKRSIVDSLKSSDFVATADFNEMSWVNAIPIRVKLKESLGYETSDVEILDQTDMMTVTLEDSDTQTFRVNPKQIGEPKAGYYVTELSTSPNIIEVSGSKTQIAKIKEVMVEVSVEGADDSFTVITQPKAVDENNYIIDGVKIEFQTNEITASATVLPTKEVLINVSRSGDPYLGYICTKFIFDPPSIIIAGTQEDLNDIGYITIPFDISLAKETKQGTVSILDYLDDRFKLVGENDSVAITATIEKQESKDIVLYPSMLHVEHLNEAYDAIIRTPGTTTLKVMGAETELEQVTAESLNPSIDLAGYEPGTYSITINCNSVDTITVRPTTISVEIVEKSEEQN